jgi:hypothetical protein
MLRMVRLQSGAALFPAGEDRSGQAMSRDPIVGYHSRQHDQGGSYASHIPADGIPTVQLLPATATALLLPTPPTGSLFIPASAAILWQ